MSKMWKKHIFKGKNSQFGDAQLNCQRNHCCIFVGSVHQLQVKLVGGHPLIFTFLSMALCGALCYTENSTTAKLDFDKRRFASWNMLRYVKVA